MERIVMLATETLKDHPQNDRFFDDMEGEAWERFKGSIQMEGILTPLRVASDMTIISGHQRWRAAKELGIDKLPCVIADDLTDPDDVERQLIVSNFTRTESSPVKRGEMIKEYERLCGIKQGKHTGNNFVSQETIAKQLGVDVRTLGNLKKLADLPDEYKELIEKGTISPTTGFKLIAGLSDEDKRALIMNLDEGQKYTGAMIQQKIMEIVGNDVDAMNERDKAVREKADALRREKSANQMREQAVNEAQRLIKEKNQIDEARKKAEEEVEALKARIHTLEFQQNEMTKKLETTAPATPVSPAAYVAVEPPKPLASDWKPDYPASEEPVDSDFLFKLTGAISGLMTTASQVSKDAQTHPTVCGQADESTVNKVKVAGEMIIKKIQQTMRMFNID